MRRAKGRKDKVQLKISRKNDGLLSLKIQLENYGKGNISSFFFYQEENKRKRKKKREKKT